MIFGVPNMQHIANENLSLFLGIFFEHTIFLNVINITYLLKKNGFKIIDIIDYKNHSTIYHVKKTSNIECVPIIQNIDYHEQFINTINDFSLYVNHCNNIIKNTNKNVYLFGASYNSQILLTIGLDRNKINGILDNCKDKQNNYLYGYNLLIHDIEIIKNDNCIVILKSGYYSEEIKEQLKTININVEIL